MKAENDSTPHNRTIKLTEIGGEYLHELEIYVNYTSTPNDGGMAEKGCTLDKIVVPAIIEAINKAHDTRKRRRKEK